MGRVDWVARRVFMSRKEGLERFGVFKKVHLDQKQSTADTRLSNDSHNKAIVYEIWCKENKVFWVAKSYGRNYWMTWSHQLSSMDSFHARNLLLARLPLTKLSQCLIFQYQDQAYELDQTTNRIGQLIKSIKAVLAFMMGHFPPLVNCCARR